VWGTAPNDVWVGGTLEMAHWDGSGWTRVETGRHGYVSTFGGSAWNDVYALVSNQRVMHYDGNTWSDVGILENANLDSTTYDIYSGLWIGTGDGWLYNLANSSNPPEILPCPPLSPWCRLL
jgi:hypothetical protein